MPEPQPLSESHLSRLESLDKKAVAAPWMLASSNSFRRISRVDGKDGGVMWGDCHRDGIGSLVATDATFALIIESRNALPALLAEVRRLREENAALQKPCDTALRDPWDDTPGKI